MQNAKRCILSANKGLIKVQRKQNLVSIQLLHVGKGGLPSFFPPMFCRIESSCFHLKAQLKHPPSPRREKEMEVKKIYHFKLSSVWTLAGVSTGAEPEETKSCQGQRDTDYTRQQRSLLLKREGRQPRPPSRLWSSLTQRGKRGSRNQFRLDRNLITESRRIFSQK